MKSPATGPSAAREASQLDFEIRSFRSAGPILFGMDRELVRKVLGSDWRPFKRSQTECDHFLRMGVFVYYRWPFVVEAVEFASPANPIFEGRRLLRETFADLAAFFAEKDANVSIGRGEVTSRKVGIGVYAPAAIDDQNAMAESVIAFER